MSPDSQMHVDAPDTAAPSPAASGSATLSDALERVDARLGGRTHVWTIVVATAVAWLVRFDQDDAFITYRFARNLARGDGLVFVPGQRVEGYTNFLWTVLLAIPERLGWSTPLFGQILGLTAFAVACTLAFRLSARFLPRRGQQLLALLVLCTNMTFLAYGTSGMETMLQTALLLGVAVVLLPAKGGAPKRSWPWVAAGAIGAAALLTRLDSAVLVAAIFAVAAVAAVRSAEDRRAALARAAANVVLAGAVAATVLTPWLVWKLGYYGAITPNTYVAKTGAPVVARLMYGAAYLLAFFLSYGVFLLVPRLKAAWSDRRAHAALAPAVAICAVWCLYICWVGADFMEFRFMVPIIPYLAVLGAVVIDPITRWSRLLVAALLLISAFHRIAPSPVVPVVSIPALDEAVQPDSQLGLGEDLRRWFRTDDPDGSPVLATTTLGAIGYGSDLRVVDMIGLTEPEIAADGLRAAHYYPGHVKIARIDQLVDAGVDLVLGTALPNAVDDRRTDYDVRELIPTWPVVDLTELPEDARVVEIPYLEGRALPAIQLRQNDAIERAIEREGWRTFPIDRSCEGEGPDSTLVDLVSFTNGTRTCKG